MREAASKLMIFWLWQTTASQVPLSDLVYILGVAATIIGLLVGFARIVSRLSHLQTTVDLQGVTISELKSDARALTAQIHQLELTISKIK